MGHITAHAEITEHVIDQLRAIMPDEDYAYLELGNFLTDISQFRDPYAFMSAKKQVLDRGVLGMFPLPVFGPPIGMAYVIPWLNELLGEAEGDKRHGVLTRFFYHISRFFAHQLFAEDSLTHLDEPYGLMPGVYDLKPLSVSEVDRVFDWAFSQYYPHEHLDFPPYHEGRDHRRFRNYQMGWRGLINYLEEQITYIVEELTKIEYAWLQKPNLLPTSPERRDLLVRLGHVLHAIEDYYFHSNFIEIWEWAKTNNYYPFRHPSQSEEDYDFVVHKTLDVLGNDPYTVRLRRRLARRLRYPVFVKGTTGHERISEDATNLVYTGGFTKTDIFHTLRSALASMEEFMLESVILIKIMASDLELIQTLFNESKRNMMAEDESYKDDVIAHHTDQLEQDLFKISIKDKLDNKIITKAGHDALIKAFEMDKEFENDYLFAPGAGGFLIEFLTQMQIEVNRSKAVTERLDNRRKSVSDKSTNNKASAETIGTHSLMAKDDFEKDPLRDEAVSLAKFASASIATLLFERLNENPDPNQGLHWDVLVRYFMRFPTPLPGRWEGEVLKRATSGTLPRLDQIKQKPEFSMLTANNPKGKLQSLRNGKKREELEKRYEALEKRADTITGK